MIFDPITFQIEYFGLALDCPYLVDPRALEPVNCNQLAFGEACRQRQRGLRVAKAIPMPSEKQMNQAGLLHGCVFPLFRYVSYSLAQAQNDVE